jgi:hypothetical protein
MMLQSVHRYIVIDVSGQPIGQHWRFKVGAIDGQEKYANIRQYTWRNVTEQ